MTVTSMPSATPACDAACTGEYASLKRLVAERGLLAHRPLRYSGFAMTHLLLATVALAGTYLLRSSWLVLLLAVPAAFLCGQAGFIAHEATHNQIARGSRANYVLSVVLFNLVLGGSRAWWADKHNAHHAQPNRLGTDPDIDGGPIAVDVSQALESRGLSRVMIRRQGLTIWPLLSLAALQIRAHSARFMLRSRVRNLVAEAVLFAAHYAVYLSLLIAFLGVGRGLAFAAIHQTLLGVYLGAAFMPNHTGMLTLEPGESMDFLHRQVLTARDLRAGRLTDYLFGSLSCQIEHHLFPAMPRHGLREAAAIVRDFCAAHDIAYHETGILDAYRESWGHLRRVAASLRLTPIPEA